MPGHELALLALIPAALLAAACSDDGDTGPVGGGGTATTGAGGGGMAAGGSGNAAGMGGSGVSGTGGAGSGGLGGGEPDAPSQTYSFTSSLEGFAVNYVCTAPAICGAPQMPQVPSVAVDAGAADAAADAGGGSGEPEFVAVSLDSALGSPDVGSARIAIQFSGPGQLINFALNLPMLNLSNKRLTAQVRLEAGGPPTTAKLYVKTGMGYVYADAGQVNLTPGAWVPLTYPSPTGMGFLANVVTFNIADVREFGIEIAAAPTSLTPAIVHVDTIQY